MMNGTNTGDMVEIKASKGEDDGYGSCLGEVIRRSGSDVLVWIKGMGEVWIPASRLRLGR